MSWRLAGLALAALASAGCATAGGGDRSAASATWWQCLADQSVRYAATGEPAETVADAVMGACAAAEGALVTAELNGLSGADRARVERVQGDGRAVVRQRVIARVVELRAVR